MILLPENFIILLLTSLLIFNLYNFIDLALPPKIKIIYPPNKITVYNNSIDFKGFADKRGDLFINELPVYFDDQGYFEKTFYLKEGLNRFIIKEKKFWGQETKIEREIIYLPR
ncbi:MAG: hypothetical protein KatS3mg096_136 [Candidatus Parcubacteria bacterium]|nr:MAG: hypothetical protein KatS3mg096_136 [Candidatus Parcubacteria bacterium]